MDLASSAGRKSGLQEVDQREDISQEDDYLYGPHDRWDEESRPIRRLRDRADRKSHFKMRKAMKARSRAQKQGRWPKEEPDI